MRDHGELGALTDIEQMIFALGLRPIAGGAGEDAGGAGQDAGAADAGQAAAGDTGAAAGTGTVESFINPADLPEELKPHWKRMHGAYTKALERTRGAGEKAGMVDRFWSDPAFARQTIQEWAQRSGVALSFGDARSAGATSAARPTGGATEVPAEFVAAVEAELPDELKWMARAQAASVWKAVGQIVGPTLRDTRDREASARSAEYDDLAAELGEVAPGWEEHEQDMTELLDFLQGPELRSRRFGSKLQLLHALVTGNATATREAVRRMGDAARNRSTTGVSGRSTVSNIEDRVRQAPTMREAWDIAKQHAVTEAQRAAEGGR